MYKEELRELYKERRNELPDEEVENLSAQIFERFFQEMNLSSVKNIHIFLPIRKKKEVNTWILIHRLRKESPEINIVVSKVDPEEEEMKSFLLEEGAVLVKNKWEVPEPVSCQPFSEKDIDMVLVPLLAFDMEGFRVGYGKGYYDKFFTICKQDVLKVGVSFFEPVDLILDIDQYDVPMDICITPEKVYKFRN